MKIVNTGLIYRIYDDDLKTYDKLPVKTFKICFNKMVGFFLEEQNDLYVDEKIYGEQESKVNKILESFKVFDRNLGVILSGDKGIGKSLCAKLLAQKSIELGYPVILCERYIPGIADYISSIEQEVVVLFDEFDKTFSIANDNDSNEPCEVGSGCDGGLPAEMLPLFDGIDQGKRLFIITCNRIKSLNEFLVNRPGRFHYHIRFDYPSPTEVREYLTDKVGKDREQDILDVIAFSGKVKINYDCLRSIAFELNMGNSFKDAIKDLNIINIDEEETFYSGVLLFKDGSKATCKKVPIDLFDTEYPCNITFKYKTSEDELRVSVSFEGQDSYYNAEDFTTIVSGDDVTVREWAKYSDFSGYDAIPPLKNKEVSMIILKRLPPKNFRYDI